MHEFVQVQPIASSSRMGLDGISKYDVNYCRCRLCRPAVVAVAGTVTSASRVILVISGRIRAMKNGAEQSTIARCWSLVVLDE